MLLKRYDFGIGDFCPGEEVALVEQAMQSQDERRGGGEHAVQKGVKSD